ncbi:MAG: hypothetical protein WCX61_02725 [Candidatus Peribacteraceae bacterium]
MTHKQSHRTDADFEKDRAPEAEQVEKRTDIDAILKEDSAVIEQAVQRRADLVRAIAGEKEPQAVSAFLTESPAWGQLAEVTGKFSQAEAAAQTEEEEHALAVKLANDTLDLFRNAAPETDERHNVNELAA